MSTYFSFFFFFNDTATTEIYTLSLHDALPIWTRARRRPRTGPTPRPPRSGTVRTPQTGPARASAARARARGDRKSTRLNSSHSQISYAVFCLKKKHINHSNIKSQTHPDDVIQL